MSGVKSSYALLIYRTDGPEPEGERLDRIMQGHRAVQREVSARGDLHAVARLDTPRAAKTVRAHDVTDGPYVEAKEWLVGFYLLDCGSEEEALEHARRICPSDDHAIEVRPVGWRWRS